jgi:alpha-tubulin suppressor-like RCC1 family protein
MRSARKSPARRDEKTCPTIFENFRRGLVPALLLITLCLGSANSAFGAQVKANFTSASKAGVSAASYMASGNSVDISLGFKPVTGTELTVVKNTGIAFIEGRFSNLQQGEQVNLAFNGETYGFVADYYGGTGNDLVLHWALQDAASWGDDRKGALGNGVAPGLLPVEVDRAGVLAGKTVVRVSAGASHGVALCSDGTVAAWGDNTYGQLGNGGTASSNVPVAVKMKGALSGKTVVAVDAGSDHNLALCSDGSVIAWGRNAQGQLGNGNTEDSHVPVAVLKSGVISGKTVVAVSAGGSHSLALCSDGKVAAWGGNASGCLGNGTAISSSQPVWVNTAGILKGRKVVSLSAGGTHSLAACSDGTSVAWGKGINGQLGNGAKINSKVPLAVKKTGVLTGKKVVGVSAGDSHSLALCSDGTAVAWGKNDRGQLGNNNTTDTSKPVAVSKAGALVGKKVVSLSAGQSYGLALCSDGTVAGWGSNTRGQIGVSGTANRKVPTAISLAGVFPNRKWTNVSAGGSVSLAIAAVPTVIDSKLSALVLGSATFQPGFSPAVTDYLSNVDETTSSVSVTPTAGNPAAVITVNGVPVPSGKTIPDIGLAMGRNVIHVIVTAEDGKSTSYSLTVVRTGQINAVYGTATDVPVSLPNGDPSPWTVNLSLNFEPTLGTNLTLVRKDGLGFFSGRFLNLVQGQAVDLSFQGKAYHFVANYFGGDGNDLVLEWANRSLAAWGFNGFMQAGSTATENVEAPTAVPDMGVLAGKTVTAVAAGYSHSLALCADGTLATWGGGAAQLGVGGLDSSSVPVAVNHMGALEGKTVVGISAASGSNLAVCSDGSVVAWGTGGWGQLGNGTSEDSDVPVKVLLTGSLAGKSVVSVAVGGMHSLAVCSDGSVLAWGSNSYGQLGDGTTTYRMTPVLVTTTGALAGKSVVAVSAGFQHSVALCSDGTLVAWGSDYYSQLGNSGDTGWGVISSVPVRVIQDGVLLGKTVVALSQAAHSSSIVLCSDGTLVSWGFPDDVYKSGDNRKAPDFVTTARALSGKFVTSVSSGGSSSLAVCLDGAVVTWGGNDYKQRGTTSTGIFYPTIVSSETVFGGKKPLFGAVAYHCLLVLAEEPDSAQTSGTGSSVISSGGTGSLTYSGGGTALIIDDPDISSTVIVPNAAIEGENFVFHFDLPPASQTTALVFQYSGDQVTWTEVNISPPSGSGVEISQPDSFGNQVVTVTVPKGSDSIMAGRLLCTPR